MWILTVKDIEAEALDRSLSPPFGSFFKIEIVTEDPSKNRQETRLNTYT